MAEGTPSWRVVLLMAEPIVERRKKPRTEVGEVAFISSGGASTRCLIDNISETGAAISVPNASYIPNRFQLMMEKDRVVRTCRLVWIMQNKIGVIFEG
jgi:PilZ domain